MFEFSFGKRNIDTMMYFYILVYTIKVMVKYANTRC